MMAILALEAAIVPRTLDARAAADGDSAAACGARAAVAADCTIAAGAVAEARFWLSAAAVRTAVRATPRRASPDCSSFRAVASRLETVPSGHPSSLAASARLMPS